MEATGRRVYLFLEFSYNNSYQASLKMSLFEALYGRKCRTPLMWSEVGERSYFGPECIQEAEEQVAKIRENLKAAQSRQKSYADTRRRDLEFAEGDHMYLKVSPIRGTRRFQVRGKLALRYIGPFKITKRVGTVALPSGATRRNVRHTQRLSCVPTEKVPKSARGTSPDGSHGPTTRSTISGATH